MSNDALSPLDFQPKAVFNVTDDARTAFLQLFVKLIHRNPDQKR